MSASLPDRLITLRVYRDLNGITHVSSDEIRGLVVVKRELHDALGLVYGAISDLAANGDKRALAFMSSGEPFKPAT